MGSVWSRSSPRLQEGRDTRAIAIEVKGKCRRKERRKKKRHEKGVSSVKRNTDNS